MTGWFGGRKGKKKKSADAARDRLQLVLIHDRTELTPGQMQAMKNELLDVISRYVDIDPGAVSIEMAQEGRTQRLLADIPVKAARRRTKVG